MARSRLRSLSPNWFWLVLQFYYQHCRQSADKTMKMPVKLDADGKPLNQEIKPVFYMQHTKQEFYELYNNKCDRRSQFPWVLEEQWWEWRAGVSACFIIV